MILKLELYDAQIIYDPNAPTRTRSGDFQVGFSYVAFAHGHCFIYQAVTCCPIPKCLTTYSSILPSVVVDGAPRALISKTKSNQSQEWEATLFRGPIFLP